MVLNLPNKCLAYLIFQFFSAVNFFQYWVIKILAPDPKPDPDPIGIEPNKMLDPELLSGIPDLLPEPGVLAVQVGVHADVGLEVLLHAGLGRQLTTDNDDHTLNT